MLKTVHLQCYMLLAQAILCIAMQAVLDRPSTEATSLPKDLSIEIGRNYVNKVEE